MYITFISISHRNNWYVANGSSLLVLTQSHFDVSWSSLFILHRRFAAFFPHFTLMYFPMEGREANVK